MPIYDLGDPRQWVSLAVDKGSLFVILWYVLTRLEATLSRLTDAISANQAQLTAIMTVLEHMRP